jgi:hypothetical protein
VKWIWYLMTMLTTSMTNIPLLDLRNHHYCSSTAAISLIVRHLMHIGHNFDYTPQEILEKCSLADFCHLAWLNEHSRNRIFLVGGGNIVEGSESYRRVDEYHRTNQTWHRRSSMMKSRGI